MSDIACHLLLELGILFLVTPVFCLEITHQQDDYYYDRSEMVKAAGSFSEFAKNYDLDVPEAFQNDDRLASVQNKNQRHWKIKLTSIDEIQKYSDIIEASSKIHY